jgi:hypothetical protein
MTTPREGERVDLCVRRGFISQSASSGHGEGGAGEQRAAQAVGGLHHGLRLLEAVGELLPVKWGAARCRPQRPARTPDRCSRRTE